MMTDAAFPAGPTSGLSTLRWHWSRGGRANVVGVDGLFVTVHSTAAYPPGAPLSARSESGRQFELKVRGCRRQGSNPDQFVIDGKLFNASRETRDHLHAAFRNPE